MFSSPLQIFCIIHMLKSSRSILPDQIYPRTSDRVPIAYGVYSFEYSIGTFMPKYQNSLEDLHTHSYLLCPTYLCPGNLYSSAKQSIQMLSTQTHFLTRFYLYCVLSHSTEASCASFVAFPEVLITCMSLEHLSQPAGVLHAGKHHLCYAQ